MKTRIHKLIIFSLLTLITFSCSNTEDDLFDEPASLRLEKSREKYQKLLEEPNQNWLLQYFPHPDQELGGINYYLTFNEGEVTAKMEGVADSKTSMYSVLNRGGNILSFYGYNELLHKYADPSVSKPKADQGDFEFLILGQKGDTINLKGLKTGNYMRLIKMSETPEEYDKKSQGVKITLSEISLYDLSDKIKVNIDKINRHIIFAYDNKQKSIAFAYTTNGLYLYEPFSYNGEKYQKFILHENNESFSSVNGELEFKVVYPPFNINKKRWVVSLNPKDNSASAEVFKIFGEAQIANDKKYGMIFYPEIDLGLMPNGTIGFRLFTVDPATFGIYPVMYNLSFRGVLGHKDQLDIKPLNPGVNWNLMPYLNPFLNILIENAPYTVNKNDAENPTMIKLISTENPEIWYVLKEPKKEDS